MAGADPALSGAAGAARWAGAATSAAGAGGVTGAVTGAVAAPAEAPVARPVERTGTEDVVVPDRPWLVIVWNDPVNLMSYVTFVFQKLFGYSLEKATKLMLDVHHKGRAVVASGTRERAELDVTRLHRHGLWATMEQPG